MKQHQTKQQTDSLAGGGYVRKYQFQVNTQEQTRGIFSEKPLILFNDEIYTHLRDTHMSVFR